MKKHTKKAMVHESFFIIFEIALAIVILSSLYKFINDAANQTIFEKNYEARNAAILANAIHFAPGDIYYDYGKKAFAVSIDGSRVEVNKAGDLDTAKSFYLFGRDASIKMPNKISGSSNQKQSMVFHKSDGAIAVEYN